MRPPSAPVIDAAGPSSRRGHDLRLYGFAGGVWAACWYAMWVRPAVALGIAVGAAVVAGAAAGLGMHARSSPLRPARHRVDTTAMVAAAPCWVLAGIALGVACGAAATAARTTMRDGEPLATLVREHARVWAQLDITDDPRALSSGRPGPTTYLVAARLSRLEVLDANRSGPAAMIRLDARVVVFASDEAWRTLLPGQRVAATARLAPADPGRLTAAVLNVSDAPQSRAPPPVWQTAAGRLRAGLQTACLPLPPEPGGLLPGLVIGDTSRLDPGLAADFRAAGMTHLVAVSGANIAIMLGVVLLGARFCRLGPWWTAAACTVALAAFVVLVRPSPSVVRAAVMGAVGLLSLAAGRARAAAPALAAAVTAGLVYDPQLAVDPGFALSALATGGLVLLAPRWRDALVARRVPRVLAEALAVSAAAQVACAPLVATLSGAVSLIAVPANLLAVPAIAPATLLGVGAAAVSPLWPWAAAVLAWLASWPARWLVAVAKAAADIDTGGLAWPAGVVGGLALAALVTGLLLAARRPRLLRLILVCAVAVAAGATPVRLFAAGWPPKGSVVVVCDVGQGDAIVLPLSGGEAVVVDTGPDPVPVDGCLRRLGVKRVPLLVLTHFHVDHIGGVAGVLRDRRVDAVAIPVFDDPATGERAVRAAVTAARVPVAEVEPGYTFGRGDLHLRVVGPARMVTGSRSDPNNNSLLLRVDNRGVSMLLAGDAEVEEQRDLLTGVDRATLRVQVLKVAHHGSAFQDPELLDTVDPIIALVSVGAGNPYGHPNAAVLDRLARDGARVLRTDVDGDLAVTLSGGILGVAVHGAHRPP